MESPNDVIDLAFTKKLFLLFYQYYFPLVTYLVTKSICDDDILVFGAMLPRIPFHWVEV